MPSRHSDLSSANANGPVNSTNAMAINQAPLRILKLPLVIDAKRSASASGQKQTLEQVRVMPALLPKADIRCRDRHVRFVPQADIRSILLSNPHSMGLE